MQKISYIEKSHIIFMLYTPEAITNSSYQGEPRLDWAFPLLKISNLKTVEVICLSTVL